jgi:dTDP-4-amino-4,6-dideoxygalactose transaminase
MAKLALESGSPIREKPFPTWPVFGVAERRALLEVFESGKWWYGERVDEFERKFAAFQDAKFGISCSSGTAGLRAALTALRVGAGDEVIVPPYSFIATASAVLEVNAIPVFADVDLETANIDPGAVEKKITSRTKAVIPVHFAGLPCELDSLIEIASANNVKLLEDACHSWGSKWDGRGTGSIGECGVFSFQMSKNMTSGEGGIVLTSEPELADRIRSFTNCGRMEGKPWYEHHSLGTNLRMTELQAALLLGQLSRLAEQTERRQENALFLEDRLREVQGIRLQRKEAKVNRRAYHLFLFRYIEEEWDGVQKARFIEALMAEGIPCSAGYPYPLYQNPLFLKWSRGPEGCPLSCPYYGKEIDYAAVSCPAAERLCREAVWLPHALLLAEEKDMRDIVDAIVKIRDTAQELK